MALVELAVEAVDTSSSCASVFVCCKRELDAGASATHLTLELLDGRDVWTTQVYEKHKPSVLDCAGSEFLAVLERCFSVAGSATKPTTRFSFKWSATKGALTLMELATASVSMKYASLGFTHVADADKAASATLAVLHGMAAEAQLGTDKQQRQQQRVSELEAVLTAKDQLLENALAAKQRLEDELFTKFCAVLNAKKDEIARLQQELAITQTKGGVSTKTRAPGATRGRKKTIGAKLGCGRKKAQSSSDSDEEDEGPVGEEDDDSSQEKEESEGESSGDDSSKNHKHMTRKAINAYSQLPSQLLPSSQFCSAADVLDDLDAIMTTGEEQDEATMSARKATGRKRPAPPARSTAPTAVKSSSEKKIKTLPVEAPAPAVPSRAAMKPSLPSQLDSEEEDILEMLA